jgi:hypothetical protein
MSSYSPTITVAQQPWIQVSSDQPTYQYVQNSIGTTPYRFDTFYQQAQNLAQIYLIMSLVKYNANGDLSIVPTVNPPNPSQIFAIAHTDFKDQNYIFNADGAFWYNVGAQEQIYAVVGLTEQIESNFLPSGKSNMQTVADATFTEFFNDYQTQL